MIGCVHLLEMAVMIAGFSLGQIRAWKYETRLNDTSRQADRFFDLVAKESNPRTGVTVRDFVLKYEQPCAGIPHLTI